MLRPAKLRLVWNKLTHVSPTLIEFAVVVVVVSAAQVLAAQGADTPAARKDAKVEIRKPGEFIQAKGPKPITPSDHLPAAALPEKPGCYHLVDGAWKAVECATEEYKRAHPLPPPIVKDSIQSVPRITTVGLTGKGQSSAAPLFWGSVAIKDLSNPTQGTELDLPPLSGNIVLSSNNAFSIQTNTNTFLCTTCKAGYPFQAIAGMPGSASAAGDTGWVQFGYQEFLPGPVGVAISKLCVWNIDLTVGWATTNNAGYNSTCVFPSLTEAVAPLTGPGAPTGTAEVIGYIQCPKSSPTLNCTLWAVAYLPWSPGSGWWTISAPDQMGLDGQWTNLNGGIMGAGGGSEAQFTNTQYQEVLHAYSCYSNPLPNGAGEAQSCPVPTSVVGQRFELLAYPAIYNPTAEWSNLTAGTAKVQCGAYDCWLSVPISAP